LTRAKIAAAAASLWQQVGPDEFSVRALARTLKVVPTTIYAHFHRGESEIRKEIARVTLEALAPHYQPKQQPEDYLRTFFRRLLKCFHQRPNLGRLVLIELCDDPMLSLVFVERMSVTIKALGGGQDPIDDLELLVSRMAGLALFEIGHWARTKPTQLQTRVQVLVYNAPATEVPTLKSASGSLGGGLNKRAAQSYVTNQADQLADVLIGNWKQLAVRSFT
jgi:AcrR family transcriptional regulator